MALIPKVEAQRISPDLEGLFVDVNCAVLTTGSQGRDEERSRLSPKELLIILPRTRSYSEEKRPSLPSPKPLIGHPTGEVLKIKAIVKNLIEKYPNEFDSRVQFQSLEDNLLSYHREHFSCCIPNRAIDAKRIAGKASIAEEYQSKATEKLRTLNHRERRSFNVTFFREAVADLESCRNGADKSAVDIKTGRLTFDGKRIKSTKYVLLRPVQYGITKHIIKAKDNLPKDFLAKRPNKIVERILWLQTEGILEVSPEEAIALSQAYAKALEWYLLSQDQFEVGVETIYVDPQELQDIAQTISHFVSN